MLNKEKLRSDIKKAIKIDPTEVIFFKSGENDFHEVVDDVEVHRAEGFFYTGKSMGGINITISDEGEIKKNKPSKRLLVAYSEELEGIDESYIVEIKGRRYRILDPGETFSVAFDMSLEVI